MQNKGTEPVTFVAFLTRDLFGGTMPSGSRTGTLSVRQTEEQSSEG